VTDERTTLAAVPIKRTYGEAGDGCMYAHAMDVFEDHWTPIVVRELLLGPKRFTDLAESAWGITAAVLTTRLQQLEARGLLTTIELAPPARGRAYALTPWGRDLEPIVLALGRWAHGSPVPPGSGDLTPDAAALALLAMAPDRPMDPPIDVELRLHDRRLAHGRAVSYRLTWSDRLRVERGSDPSATAIVRTDATTLARRWLLRADDGDLTIDGNERDVARLVEGLRVEAGVLGAQ
jgi:DNA-binding HxlR family transcriptional regulator